MESFERIHRSNLIGMGVLPLQFPEGVNRKTLKLTGDEIISLTGLDKGFEPQMNVTMTVKYPDGSEAQVALLSRIDTSNEANYYRHGGILQFVLHKMLKSS